MRSFDSAVYSRSFLLSKILCTFVWFVGQVAVADQADTPASKGSVLNGSLEEKAKMESSLKLLIEPPASSTPAPPVKLNIQQFSGGTQYSPGQPAPPLPLLPPSTLQTGIGLKNVPPFPQPPSIVPGFSPPVQVMPKPILRWNYTVTPANGIMTYGAEYGVRKIAQPRVLTRHANLSLAFPNTQGVTQQTSFQLLPMNKHVIQWAPMPVPVELKATQFRLTPMVPQKCLAPPANWEQWYQRVARAIYDRWRINAVGPGKATVLITIYDTRNVDCKVVDFTPADGAGRNVATETAFRVSALKTITGLDGDQVWQFPNEDDLPNKVVFDMQFDHAVGTTPGCAVVHTHSNPSMVGLQ